MKNLIWEFPEGVTVKELKSIVHELPETDSHGRDYYLYLPIGPNTFEVLKALTIKPRPTLYRIIEKK